MALRRSPKKLDLDALFDYGLKTLSARALSISETRRRLLSRAEHPDDVDIVLTRLKEYGYLNDQRFAESFANARLENQGFGKMRVLRDLRLRRVAPKVAEHAVEQTFKGQNEIELIEEYLQRKYRNYSLPEHLSDQKNLASVYRRLRYAGFSHGNSVKVLLRYVHEAELLEKLEDEPLQPSSGEPPY